MAVTPRAEVIEDWNKTKIEETPSSFDMLNFLICNILASDSDFLRVSQFGRHIWRHIWTFHVSCIVERKF